MAKDIIQSAWGIVYYREADREPRYLLIKRYARSHKIERVAPKGKIQKGEKIEETVLREVSEEVWIPINQMKIGQKLWKTQLRNTENIRGYMNKDVTYFSVEYKGNPDAVHIEEIEWYLWVYKRATIHEVLTLVYYQNVRELFRDSYQLLRAKSKKDTIKKNFMNSI